VSIRSAKIGVLFRFDHDALAYAYDHPEEMEADLAADDEELVQEQWAEGRR
jgi:hypothetical protein